MKEEGVTESTSEMVRRFGTPTSVHKGEGVGLRVSKQTKSQIPGGRSCAEWFDGGRKDGEGLRRGVRWWESVPPIESCTRSSGEGEGKKDL